MRELDRIAAATAITAFIATAPAVSQAQSEDVSGEITLMSYAGIFEDQYKQAVIEPFLEAYPKVSVNYFTTGNSAQMLGALRAHTAYGQFLLAALGDVDAAEREFVEARRHAEPGWAYTMGRFLVDVGRADDARAYLQVAADAGDRVAADLLAELDGEDEL